jgi:spore maturation protein SpmB
MTQAAPRPQLAHLTAALNALRASGTLDHALETMERVAKRLGIL